MSNSVYNSMDPKLIEYLLDKQQAKDEAEYNKQEQSQGLAFSQMASGIGDALARRDSSSTDKFFDGVRSRIHENTIGKFEKDNKEQLADMDTEQKFKTLARQEDQYDPNSERSKMFRQSVESQFPDIAKSYGDKWNNVSVADQELLFKPLEMKQKQEDRALQRQIQQNAMQNTQFNRQQALEMKQQDKQAKQQEKTKEFDNRYETIQNELNNLDKLIEEKGTFEMFGDHEKNLQQKLDSIAIDSAKMFDPQSVARESEVAAFKKMLFEPGTLGTRNSTARDIVKNYKKMLQDRAKVMSPNNTGAQEPQNQAPETQNQNKPKWAK